MLKSIKVFMMTRVHIHGICVCFVLLSYRVLVDGFISIIQSNTFCIRHAHTGKKMVIITYWHSPSPQYNFWCQCSWKTQLGVAGKCLKSTLSMPVCCKCFNGQKSGVYIRKLWHNLLHLSQDNAC